METRGSTTRDTNGWAVMDECWRRGTLEHLLDSNQLEMYRAIHASPVLQFVVQASRKIGKSYMLAVIAFETALSHPGKRINYAAPSGKECVEMTLPIMREIAELAPADCRPTWAVSRGHWEFPNGAFIVVFGAEDIPSANRGRGPESYLNIADEAAFCPVLFYLIESVLAPQTLQTRARTLIASTPPESPGHDFVGMAEAAAAVGAYIHRDVYSHGRMTFAQIEEFLGQRAQSRNMTLEQYKKTTDFLREYMAQTVLDSNLAMVPEFPGVKERVVEAGKVASRPPFFDIYASGDPGMSHKFGCLFGYLDFRRSRFVIEYELLLDRANTKAFADAFQDVLIEHYPCPQDDVRSMRLVTRDSAYNVQKPHSATLDDHTTRICADLWTYHGLSFSPALKDDVEAAINLMRLHVGGLKFEIHPRCVNLIRQLGTAVRTKPGGPMAANPRDGHYDLVSSLWYLCRSIDWSRNPYPQDFGYDANTQVRREVPPPQSLSQVLLRGTSLGRRR